MSADHQALSSLLTKNHSNKHPLHGRLSAARHQDHRDELMGTRLTNRTLHVLVGGNTKKTIQLTGEGEYTTLTEPLPCAKHNSKHFHLLTRSTLTSLYGVDGMSPVHS